MQFSTLTTVLLLPLLAVAQYPTSSTSLTTTVTSTQTMTKTITVSQVVASVTSTYPCTNSTVVAPTNYPSATYTAASKPATTSAPANFMGAASNLNGMYAGSAGLIVMMAAALL